MQTPTRCLYVGYIHKKSTKADLVKEFKKFGKILNVNKSSSKDYGYIEFEKIQDAENAAKEKNGKKLAAKFIKDEKMLIKFAEEDKASEVQTQQQQPKQQQKATKKNTDSNTHDPERLLKNYSRHQLEKALTAIKKYSDKNDATANDLLGNESGFVHLEVTVDRSLPVNRKAVQVPLSSPIFGDYEVCLIVHDEVQELAKKNLKESGIAGTAMSYKEFTTEHATFDSRRRVVGSYNLFFVDRSLLDRLNTDSMSVSEFHKARKFPIPVRNLGKTPEGIKAALSQTSFYIPVGTSVAFKVSRTNFEVDKALKNVNSAISEVLKIVPEHTNIISLALKFDSQLPSLPFYNFLPNLQPHKLFPKRTRQEIDSNQEDQEDIEELSEDEPVPSSKKQKKQDSDANFRAAAIEVSDGDDDNDDQEQDATEKSDESDEEEQNNMEEDESEEEEVPVQNVKTPKKTPVASKQTSKTTAAASKPTPKATPAASKPTPIATPAASKPTPKATPAAEKSNPKKSQTTETPAKKNSANKKTNGSTTTTPSKTPSKGTPGKTLKGIQKRK